MESDAKEIERNNIIIQELQTPKRNSIYRRELNNGKLQSGCI